MNYQSAFEAIIKHPRYLANLDYGKPRHGHPEGTVRAHIAEIEPNLEALRPKLSDEEYWKLRLLIHTHDSFKAESKRDVPIADPNSHGSIAAKFLGEFCGDANLLAMCQWHDEPYALFRQFESKGQYSQDRLGALLQKIGDFGLFMAFQIIDGCTAGKSRKPLEWFFVQIADVVDSRFTAKDIIGVEGAA